MNILFVCTGNTCRSPMAQGIFQKMLTKKSGDYTVDSAGIYTHPGSSITPQAENELKHRKIDLHGRIAAQLSIDHINSSDLIFTMTDNQRRLLVENFPFAADKIHLLGDYTNRGGDICDPYGGDQADYTACAAEIEKMLDILIDMI